MAKLEPAKSSIKSLSLLPKSGAKAITHYLPFLDWLVHYRRDNLVGDLLAGSIVAIMLVPQGMAYAMLAGLPPEIGLYASIVPLVIYGLLGSSFNIVVVIFTVTNIAALGLETNLFKVLITTG